MATISGPRASRSRTATTPTPVGSRRHHQLRQDSQPGNIHHQSRVPDIPTTAAVGMVSRWVKLPPNCPHSQEVLGSVFETVF
jgi:hypothetical protein